MSTERKWTAGPWIASQDEGYVFAYVDSKSGMQGDIATVRGVHVSAFSNTHLLGASLDLYEALEDMLASWRYIRQQHGDLYGVGWDRCEQVACAALAKARGETP